MVDSILEFYKKEMQAGQASVPWIAAVQKKALREFEYRAFPSRKDEEWKYTALDSFLAERFSQQDTRQEDLTLGAIHLIVPDSSAAINLDRNRDSTGSVSRLIVSRHSECDRLSRALNWTVNCTG